MLEQLFPFLSESKENFYNQHYYRQHGRIAAHDRLMISLSFGLPSEEVSSQDVQNFIIDPNTRNNLSEIHFTNQKIERFLVLLIDEFGKVSPPDDIKFLHQAGRSC